MNNKFIKTCSEYESIALHAAIGDCSKVGLRNILLLSSIVKLCCLNFNVKWGDYLNLAVRHVQLLVDFAI